MTRIGRRLIEDFLLPALDDRRYGELLKWLDQDKQLFSIRWSHKNAAKWTLDDTAVFQDWDKLKGHYHPEIKGYYMQAKQRFRAALYKLNSVRKIPCDDKHVKKYQLLIDHEKRREIIGRRLKKKEGNQKSIPTSVICKNTSYSGKRPKSTISEPIYPMSSPPSSPASSTKSDLSDPEELEKCLFEYTLAQKKQMMINSSMEYKVEYKDAFIKEENDDSNFSDDSHTPHLSIQPVHRVYNGSLCQIFDSSQKRFESPHVLLVRTFNESEDEYDVKVKSEPCDFGVEYDRTPINLSVKSEDSEALSR